MENITLIKPVTDFSEILNSYGLKYQPAGFYWQVGHIPRTQGWILHLSVIKLQTASLIHMLLPVLLSKKIPFKVARDLDVVSNLLEGGMGYINLAKIISIYPSDDKEANVLARDLIELTKSFRGPVIPTDRHLGSIVYTRYGSFNPIRVNNPQGLSVNHIYDAGGKLIPDPYLIPFSLPPGIIWPFDDITSPSPPRRRKLLNYAYYPLITLKPDAKGEVIKALYFQKFWRIRSCLIKQGKQNMFVDEAGRDIRNRLEWQHDLYQSLHKYIPLPEVFDHFQEDSDSYLAMAFIKGVTLTVWIDSVYHERSWPVLPVASRLQLLDRLLEILAILERLHEEGFVHRDINSNNFLIDRKGKIWLIDMELAWCLSNGRPDPPFSLGTAGYMSPEQYGHERPTIQQDIYAIGALAMEFLTNIYPLKLNQQSPAALKDTLVMFTGEELISASIAGCQSEDPSERPDLRNFRQKVEQFRDLVSTITPLAHPEFKLSSDTVLQSTIDNGLAGLAYTSVLHPVRGWFSLKQLQETHIGNHQVALDLYKGWHTGMAGPLWLVACAKSEGFNIDALRSGYSNSWKYIEGHYFNDTSATEPGLYSGSAGIAMAMATGMDSGLLTPDEKTTDHLQACFSLSLVRPGLCDGLAGQGIALLKSAKWIGDSSFNRIWTALLNNLLMQQQADGSWNQYDGNAGKSKSIFTGLDHGVAGIALFLLAALGKYPGDPAIRASVQRSMEWLIKKRQKKGKKYRWAISSQSSFIDKWTTAHGMTGIALVCLKAYEELKEPLYREMAEGVLLSLPSHPVCQDLSLGYGLAGLGELYLEAFRVLNDQLWLERAGWIAQFLILSCKSDKNNPSYWLPAATNITTADLFTGNSGILYFLMHYQRPHLLRHPLWPLAPTE